MKLSHTRISLTAALACAAIAMVPTEDSKSGRDRESRLAPFSADTTLAEGAFTEAQSKRGNEVFTRDCSECHEVSDMRGEIFMFNWEGSSVGRLYRTINRTMPETDPGSLSTPDYLAVVSYILGLNGFPAGENELPSDTELLNKLRIEH